MKEKKKTWTRPHLVVLGRGQPEESVLDKCKNISPVQGGPATATCLAGNSNTRCKTAYES